MRVQGTNVPENRPRRDDQKGGAAGGGRRTVHTVRVAHTQARSRPTDPNSPSHYYSCRLLFLLSCPDTTDCLDRHRPDRSLNPRVKLRHEVRIDSPRSGSSWFNQPG
jgi:hypothetical protein